MRVFVQVHPRSLHPSGRSVPGWLCSLCDQAEGQSEDAARWGLWRFLMHTSSVPPSGAPSSFSCHLPYDCLQCSNPLAVHVAGHGSHDKRKGFVRKGMAVIHPDLLPNSWCVRDEASESCVTPGSSPWLLIACSPLVCHRAAHNCACRWEFKAEILVLHHQTTLSVGYAPIIHVGTVVQCASISGGYACACVVFAAMCSAAKDIQLVALAPTTHGALADVRRVPHQQPHRHLVEPQTSAPLPPASRWQP